MKRILILGLLVVVAGCCLAEEAQVAGLWKNTAEGIKKSAVIISQQGATIHVAGYGEWAGGGPGAWHSKGARIEGTHAKISITYTTKPMLNFDPSVELDLQLSSDSKTLEGTWKNSQGKEGPVKFVKVESEAGS